MLDAQARAFDSFQEEKPIGKVRIDQHIEIRELDQKGSVTDPGNGDLATGEFGKSRLAMLTSATGQQGFPDHFPEECPRVKMLGGRKVFEGAWEGLAGRAWTSGGLFRHNLLVFLLIFPFE